MSSPSADSSLPARASVVVIGGGVMGCSVLYHLAKMGAADCVLLEKHKLSAGTTWHSAAQVRTLRSGKNLTAMALYAAQLYPRLEEETGHSAGWQNTGALSIACSPGRLAHIHRQKAVADMCGASANLISAGEAKERWPLLNEKDVIGAVWSPDDGRVGPTDLCAALAKGATAAGARVVENAEVGGIVLRGGKVAGVETSRGHIETDAIAVCAGLWSRETAALAGANAALWPCEHFYLLTRPFGGIVRLPVLADHDSHLYIRDESGGLLVGCFEPHARAADPARLKNFAFQLLPEDWDHFEPMMQNALHRIPALADAEIKTLLNGPESFTPDGKCLLGETLETPGLFLGCGMNSVGVVSGAGAGRALAECMLRKPPTIPLPEADPKRFPACWNSAAALSVRAPETLGTTYDIHYPGWQKRSARNLRHTPLHAVWQKHGAHFGQTAGWERPLYFNKTREPTLTFDRPEWFAQTGAEARRATEEAAVFELSPLGVISVCGADAEKFLNRVCANDMTKPPGRVIYTLMLNEHGGIESDLTAFRLSEECYRLHTGAADIGRDLAWLRRHLKSGERADIADESGARAMLGLFGARAGDIAAAAALNSLRYFHHGESEIAGRPVRAARMSYIGEFGWEITCEARDAAAVFAALEKSGACPAGLYAQNAMRIEKRFSAYHHELDSGVTPEDAGLEFSIDWRKPFVGKDALRSSESRKKIVGIVLEDEQACPLGEEPVYDGGGICGRTTSGAFGYRVQKPVALAMINRASLSSEKIAVEIAGQRFAGKIIDGAIYDPSGARMKPPA